MSARSLARNYDRFMLRNMLESQVRAVRKGTRYLNQLKLALGMRNKMERADRKIRRVQIVLGVPNPAKKTGRTR